MDTSEVKLKHEDEWPLLIKLAEEHSLTSPQILFLLALREVESGTTGNEFNVKTVQNTSLKEQALWAIGSIRANEKRYQKYLIENSNTPDYVSFFAVLGGPYGNGYHIKGSTKWALRMREFIKEIGREL